MMDQFKTIEDMLSKIGEYMIMHHKGETVPTDDISKLIKFTKNFLVNPENEPGTQVHKEYLAGFKQRVYDYSKGLFYNEPEILHHMGGEPFVRICDEIIDQFRFITEKMIYMLKEQLLAKADPNAAFRVLKNGSEFSRSTFFRLSHMYKQPHFDMISANVFDDAEQRIFDSLKFILPRIIDKAVVGAAQQKVQHLDWVEVVYQDEEVRSAIEMLTEIAQIRFL